MSLLDKIKKHRVDLQERQQEENERKDPTSFKSGSVIIADKLPEGMEIWRPGIGEHYFDVLPWVASDKHPYEAEEAYCWCIVLMVYRDVGVMRDQFVAPYLMYDEPDPIAEYIASHNLSKAEFKKRVAKKRCFYQVWVHDTPEEEKKGVQLWEVAHWFMYDQLKELSVIPKDGGHVTYMDWTKKDGKQIYQKIKSEGTFEGEDGTKVDSIQYLAPKFLDRKADIPDSILNQIIQLETVIHCKPTYDEIHKAFYGKEKTGDAPDAPAARSDLPKSDDDDIPSSMETHKECPSDHSFGIDIDAFPADCNNCSAWDDCSDEKDRLAEGKSEPDPPKEEPKEEPEKTTGGRLKLRGRLGKRD